mgnify:CR=1 FL=1
MKVLKFGGSSVANADNIKKVITIIQDTLKRTSPLIVVVSALGGITDELINLANTAASGDNQYVVKLQEIITRHNQVVSVLIDPTKLENLKSTLSKKYTQLSNLLQGVFLLQELPNSTLDAITSFGEQLSSLIIASALESNGIDCQWVDSLEIIRTDSHFGEAKVDLETTYKLCQSAFSQPRQVFVCGGFIGSSYEGEITTLGRGGSDYTAAIVGAAMAVEVIEIWTDVDGVLTADPRKVPSAFPLTAITYTEAGELAHFGAKVIHPKTMYPAQQKRIPILIKNTFNPTAPGTLISDQQTTNPWPITGVTALTNISLLTLTIAQTSDSNQISWLMSQILNLLSQNNIEVILISQASYENSFSLAISSKLLSQATQILNPYLTTNGLHTMDITIKVTSNLAILSIIGNQMRGIPGTAGRFFKTLGNQQINVYAIAQGASELTISAVIDEKQHIPALQAVHQEFFVNQDDKLHLFLVGTGLIGSTLLKQLSNFQEQMVVNGLANSQHFLIQLEPLILDNWAELLKQGQPCELDKLVDQIIALPVPNKVFVDCTASADIPKLYPKLLSQKIAIVTPNKKANSESYSFYQELKTLAKQNQVKYLYETTVGAALPIIQTIQDLVKTGDEIVSIEAILSGTLSYIFNTFSVSDEPFSQIVRQAQAKGYTEPDPRDDLNGLDMARKLLILAREIGLKLELSDIQIEPILPDKCFLAKNVEEFFVELTNLDSHWNQQREIAKQQQRVFRYIGQLGANQAKLALVLVDQHHPFFNLTGNDNIISITTRRYQNNPLVIKGPGAGAEVTAGGILADLLKIKAD